MDLRVLVVDDDPAVRTSLARALERRGAEVLTAEDGPAAVRAVTEHGAEVVFTDVRMPGMDGLELLRLLRARSPDVDVVVISGHNDLPVVAEAMKHGAIDMLIKPIELDELYAVLDRIREDRSVREGTAAEAPGAPGLPLLVGRDPRMVEIFKTVGLTAGSRAAVLIRGESGTGKELVARAIHEASDHSGEPFVAVNCNALAPNLLESELFGHVKGSFTGASSDRRGLFAQAGKGTIFLDEIGDTTPEFQAKLLRVLQEQEFSPVGSDQRVKMAARTIAATHRPLEDLVRRESFREDLYYRLRVVEIVIPPLRDRPGDVPLLAEHLVRRVADAAGVGAKRLSKAALELLVAHEWPGNVRELENCLTRAVVMSSGAVIHPEHLILRPEGADGPERLETLDTAEARHVARVLASTGGNKSEAARVLDISRPRLDRIIKKHGLAT